MKKNTARLWREELDEILATDRRPRLPSAIAKTDKALEKLLKAEAKKPSSEFRSTADIRRSLRDLAATMRRNSALVAALRAEGRHLLDARAAVLVAVERLAMRFPDREEEKAFESALAAALSWCLDLEARAKAGDTGDTTKKNREAIPRESDNRDFHAALNRLKRPIENFEAEARDWWCKQNRKKAEALTEEDRKKIKALAVSARRAFKKKR